jgi:hypothetical protein
MHNDKLSGTPPLCRPGVELGKLAVAPLTHCPVPSHVSTFAPSQRVLPVVHAGGVEASALDSASSPESLEDDASEVVASEAPPLSRAVLESESEVPASERGDSWWDSEPLQAASARAEPRPAQEARRAWSERF